VGFANGLDLLEYVKELDCQKCGTIMVMTDNNMP